MERQQWSGFEGAPANGLGGQVSPFLAPSEGAGKPSNRQKRHHGDTAIGLEACRLADDDGSERITRLSLNEFCERVALLAELELPCSVHIANPSAEQISRGVVRRIERDADRLNLIGNGFSLHLHRDNIDSIWLVTGYGGDDQGMAIEIHNRTGSLIARLFGMEDSVDAAVWRDVMGNPSFAVA